MIRVDSISKSYPGGDLFSNVSISIKKGMRIGLVGKNGSGKTTLLRIMLNKESPDNGNVQIEKSIKIGYLAQDTIECSKSSVMDEVKSGFPNIINLEKKIKNYTELVSENPDTLNYVKKLGEYQTHYESLNGWDLEKKIKKILGGLGFKKNQFNLNLEVFSGGWRMRVALAKILSQKPDVLFLDEPTNHLDLDATIWLETFISKWDGSLVLISHDKEFLDRSVNNILEIDLKKVVLYKGNFSEYKINKRNSLEQYISNYKNQQKQIKETERFIDRFRYKSSKAVQVQSRIKMLKKLDLLEPPEQDKKNINIKFPQTKRSPLIVAKFKSVKKEYSNVGVFKNMSFTVERGNKIGLVGRNGAGKSTLIKMLAGVENITEGDFNLGAGVIGAYYAQHQLEILESNDTVFQTIYKKGSGFNETEIRTYLGGFLFSGEEIEKQIKVLSGGEKARLAMAAILINPVDLLLLDEPTNHLDMDSRSIIEDVLQKFSGSIVCISHDRHFMNKVTNRICEVEDGDVKIYEGNYSYYEWKTSNRKIENSNLSKIINYDKKKDFKKRKKLKNRLASIQKRFKIIEIKLEENRLITIDSKNSDDYIKLNDAMKNMNLLEVEYLNLMEEQESIEKQIL